MPKRRKDLGEYKNLSAFLLDLIGFNRKREPVGLYSICSASRSVLEAGFFQATRDDSVICIESTSNQVNQFGGYTGMTPVDFARFVKEVASAEGFAPERIILGGDHLGPHVWQNEPAAQAMAKARELVRSCVLAGYTKIHLDTSMRCADDPGDAHTPLRDEVVTRRATDLCLAAEAAHAALPGDPPPPVYVIGTEVPIPGGAQTTEGRPAVTRVQDVERTVSLARTAFIASGLQSAWDRVIAVVVQPGVEFGDASVFEYDREQARQLPSYIEQNWSLVFEAHSTDYQPHGKLKQMVADHFAVLKVGPWLTFAFREAVFALAAIEKEWLGGRKGIIPSEVVETLERIMLADPVYWKKYYRGDENYLRFARKYSYSDRSRYYWPHPEVQAALSKLLSNLSETSIPPTLLSQFLPSQYAAVRRGTLRENPVNLIRHKILEVLDIYASACGMCTPIE